MAQIDEKQIEEIVSQVLRTLQQAGSTTAEPTVSVGASSSPGWGFCDSRGSDRSCENGTGSIC